MLFRSYLNKHLHENLGAWEEKSWRRVQDCLRNWVSCCIPYTELDHDDLTLARMDIIKKSTNNKCWRGCGEKGTLWHGWWECKLIQLLWRTVWRFLKKLKIELPSDPAIPLLGMYPEKTVIQKRHMHPNVHCSTIYNSQDMEVT